MMKSISCILVISFLSLILYNYYTEKREFFGGLFGGGSSKTTEVVNKTLNETISELVIKSGAKCSASIDTKQIQSVKCNPTAEQLRLVKEGTPCVLSAKILEKEMDKEKTTPERLQILTNNVTEACAACVQSGMKQDMIVAFKSSCVNEAKNDNTLKSTFNTNFEEELKNTKSPLNNIISSYAGVANNIVAGLTGTKTTEETKTVNDITNRIKNSVTSESISEALLNIENMQSQSLEGAGGVQKFGTQSMAVSAVSDTLNKAETYNTVVDKVDTSIKKKTEELAGSLFGDAFGGSLGGLLGGPIFKILIVVGVLGSIGAVIAWKSGALEKYGIASNSGEDTGGQYDMQPVDVNAYNQQQYPAYGAGGTNSILDYLANINK
jgi:hypothetical protein